MWKLIDRLKTLLFFKIATIYLRYLIGFAFVFASYIKIRGERFTRISVSDPVGYFFEAMYQTGFYWNFLGWGQFIAGSLLMSQRFSTVGAMVFFPIILNVCMITFSINFGTGTPTITLLMLLGTIYLLLWDYKKWIILFQRDHNIKLDLTKQPEDKFITDPIWTITGITFIILSAVPTIFEGKYMGMWMIAMLAVGLSAFGLMMKKHLSATRSVL
jgi:hypothetical protein